MTKRRVIVVAYGVNNLNGTWENRGKYLNASILGATITETPMGEMFKEKYIFGHGMAYRRIPLFSQNRGITPWINLTPLSFVSYNVEQIQTQTKNYIDNTQLGFNEVAEILDVRVGDISLYDWGFYYLSLNPQYSYIFEMNFAVNYNETTSVFEYSVIDEVTGDPIIPEIHIPAPPPNTSSEGLYCLYRKFIQPPPKTYTQTQEGPLPGTSVPIPPYSGYTLVSSYIPTDPVNGYYPEQYIYNKPGVPFQTGDVIGGEVQTTNGSVSNVIIYEVRYPNTGTPSAPIKGTDPYYVYYQKQDNLIYAYGPSEMKVIAYINGTGNGSLDAIINTSKQTNTYSESFFPFLPLRIDHQEISSLVPSMWPKITQVGKKINMNVKKILREVKKEADWDKFSYIFIKFGVGINGHNRDRKNLAQYLWYFFQQFYSQSGGSDMAIKLAQYEQAVANYAALMKDREQNPQNYVGIPLPTPPTPPQPSSRTTFKYKSNAPNMGFELQFAWDGMQYLSGTGALYPGVPERGYRVFNGNEFYKKIDDWENNPDKTVTPPGLPKLEYSGYSCIIYHQINSSSWEAIEIRQLEERVVIFKGEYILNISGQGDLNDEKLGRGNIGLGKDSDLIIPILPSALKKAGLISYTQLATEGSWLAVHAYVKTKRKKKGLRWVLAILVIVVTILIPPAGVVSAGGITAGGVSAGAIASVVASIAIKMVIGIILLKVLTWVAVKLFGQKWGYWLAVVAYVFITAYTGNFSGNNSLGNLTQAPNLLAMSSQIAGSVSQYYTAKIKETQQKWMAYQKESQEYWDEIYTKLYEVKSIIDPGEFLDIIREGMNGESRDSFLNRTLATGSDIADQSITFLLDSPEFTLHLPLKGIS